MRKKIYTGCVYAGVAILAFGLVFYGEEVSAAAVAGLELCAGILIPSLFPFFVISALFIKTGFARRIGHALQRPMSFLFGVPGVCAPAFILGCIGGYPVGAKAAVDLYQQGYCTKGQAERLLQFCNNCSPGFILGTVGIAVFGSLRAGIILFAGHVLAAATVGVLFRGSAKRGSKNDNKAPKKRIAPLPFSKAFTESVISSLGSTLNVCAFVIFFRVIIELLSVSGIIHALSGAMSALPLGVEAGFYEAGIAGFIEVTTGVSALTSLGEGSALKLSLAALLLGWAGICVHFQSVGIIGESGLSAAPHIRGKAAQGVIACIYTALYTRFFGDISVSLPVSSPQKLPFSAPQTYVFLINTVCILLLLAVLVVIACKKKNMDV